MNGEFIAALQRAKEEMGEFANGDGSLIAQAAKRLWYVLDNEQRGFEKLLRGEGVRQ